MTNKEAIKGLTDLKELAKELIFEDSDPMLLSLDIAIKALKARQRLERFVKQKLENNTFVVAVTTIKEILEKEGLSDGVKQFEANIEEAHNKGLDIASAYKSMLGEKE